MSEDIAMAVLPLPYKTEEEFAVGDRVRHKSGGPIMIAGHSLPDTCGKRNVYCTWWQEGAGFNTLMFAPGELRSVEKATLEAADRRPANEFRVPPLHGFPEMTTP